MKFLMPALLLGSSLISYTATAKEPTGNVAVANHTQTKSLSFIENKGQITDQYGKARKDIDYKLDGSGVTMFVGDGALHYQWVKSPLPASPHGGSAVDSKRMTSTLSLGEGRGEATIYRMDVELIGANKNAELIAEDKQGYYENYYRPYKEEATTAYSYKKITYKNVYKNIDWVIYTSPLGGGREGAKYDFVVHEGGNPADIKIQYKGATKLAIQDGALIATTPYGSITENAPYSYWADSKKELSTNFVLNGNILTYYIPRPTGAPFQGGILRTDESGEEALIIDPSLNWATYFGGSNDESVLSVATDSAGNVYMGGWVSSASNVATTGAFQTSFAGGNSDGLLVKFDIGGARLWATYYGGNDVGSGVYERFFSVSSEPNGTVYGGFYVQTPGMATIGAFQTTGSGGMLVKFNNAGVRQWATYYNGDCAAVHYDKVNNAVYIGGYIPSSSTNIATTGAYKTTQGSFDDGHLTRFTTGGSRVWGTYFYAHINAICTDAAGNIYVAGESSGLTSVALATTGAFQSANAGNADGFVGKFNAAGTNYLWGTFYGGTLQEQMYDITTDLSGNVYIAGSTRSTSGISSTGSHQPAIGGTLGNDGFIAKFNSTGTRQWASYYGGAGDDITAGICNTSKDDIIITGYSASSNGIATPGSLQTINLGSSNVYFAIFNTAGLRKYGTYYGLNTTGGATVTINGVSSYCKDRLYLSFKGTVVNTTSGAYQAASGGGWDCVMAQFLMDTSVYIPQPFVDTVVCSGDTLSIPYGVTQNFRSSNVFTIQLSSNTGSFASPTTIGTVNSNTSGKYNWVVPSSITSGSGYRVRVIASGPADTAYEVADIKLNPTPVATATSNSPICSGNTLSLGGSSTVSGVTWSWTGPSFSSSLQNPTILNAPTTASGDYILTADMNGCIGKDTVTTTVKLTPAKPTANNNGPLCNNGILSLTSFSTTPGVGYNWSGPSYTSTLQNPTINPATIANSGTYSVYADLNGCSSLTTTTTVSIVNGPTVAAYPSPNDTICFGNAATFTALPTNPGSSPSYQWLKNGSMIPGATSLSYNTSNITDGDVFSFLLTPGTGAACNTPVNSNMIPMTVIQYTQPIVAISASDTNAWPGLLVTFNVTSVSGGTNPIYQWKVNNQPIIGATSNTWGTTQLANNDNVCVVMTPSFLCPNPATATACKKIHVATGISHISNSKLKVYPNPTQEELHVGGLTKGTMLQIADVMGRVVSPLQTSTQGGDIVIPMQQLPSGNYILQLTYTNGERDNVKVVKE